MAGKPYASGSDAAYIKPRFIPDDELHARDDSGGPGFKSPTADFGDGGRVTGPKAHLNAKGGSDKNDTGDDD